MSTRDGESEPRLTEADVLAHAAALQSAPWWSLFEAEQALPPCPTCGGPMVLLVDGAAACERSCPP